jgi:recombination protein RecA
MINQISDQIGIFYDLAPRARILTPGGRYKEFMCQLRIEASTRSIESTKEHPLTGKPLNLGWEVNYRLVKNKFINDTGNRIAKAEFMFNPPGFCRGVEVLRAADYLGIIEKKGHFYTVGDKKFNGEPRTIAYLEENPDVRVQIEKQVLLRRDELFADKQASTGSELLD